MPRLLLAGWLAFAALPAVAAGPVVLGPQDFLKLTYAALAAGDAETALQMADALIARDPSDALALIAQSRAARDLGQISAARAAARAAIRVADTPDERFGAAMVMAQALSSAGQRTAAQYWLRRAAQAAPSDQARALAVRDFGYVKARNPLVLGFDFGLSPSSNINGGSASSTLRIPGLPFVFALSGDAQALSGTELALGFGARYRLPPQERSATELRLSASGRHYWLSQAAKLQAPAARGSDYDFAALEIGVAQKRALGSGIADLALSLGRNWYGGAVLSDVARLDFGYARPVSARISGSVGLSLERQARRDVAARSANLVSVTGGIGIGLRNGDALRFSVLARQAQSASSEIDHHEASLSLDWTRAALIGPLRLGAGIAVSTAHYDRSPYSRNGRADRRLAASLVLGLEGWDYLGFSPEVTVTAARTHSNISLYEQRDVGVALGIRSAF